MQIPPAKDTKDSSEQARFAHGYQVLSAVDGNAGRQVVEFMRGQIWLRATVSSSL
jgi:hypothetical protein